VQSVKAIGVPAALWRPNRPIRGVVQSVSRPTAVCRFDRRTAYKAGALFGHRPKAQVSDCSAQLRREAAACKAPGSHRERALLLEAERRGGEEN